MLKNVRKKCSWTCSFIWIHNQVNLSVLYMVMKEDVTQFLDNSETLWHRESRLMKVGNTHSIQSWFQCF